MKKGYSFRILLFIACWLFVIAAPALAQQKTHVVKKGETLFSIASQYEISVEKLKTWNNLDTNELEVGEQLIVRQPETEEPVIHTVQKQETLYSISKQYGVSITELKSWNELSGNNLEMGQELKIYRDSRGGQVTGDPSESSIVTKGNTQQKNTYYTVKSGDTLYRIAREHNMSVSELKALNDLRSNTIAVGQQLTVRETSAPPSVAEAQTEVASSPQGKFVSHRVEEPTTLDKLLRKFKMEREEFAALNPGNSDSTFRKGQKVTVLAPATKTYSNPYISSADLKNLGVTPASRYGESDKGKTTTSGELYSPSELTAAHSNIAIGTVILVQNPDNNRGLYLRINDRISDRGLKLSSAAWNALDISSPQPKVKIYQDQ